MSQLVLKTEFNGDVRRITIAANISFNEISMKVCKLYGFAACVILKYLDDENDLITIGSDEELEEAYRIGIARKILRLFVSVGDAPLPISLVPDVAKSKVAETPVLIAQWPIVVPIETKSVPIAIPLSLSSSPLVYDANSPLLLRQQSLIESTSARVNQLSEEINQKTAKLSNEQAIKPSHPVYIVPGEFITHINSLSSKTADMCTALSDKISAKQAELADLTLASSPELRSKLLEIETNCNELSRKTNERCHDISTSLYQKLMSL